MSGDFSFAGVAATLLPLVPSRERKRFVLLLFLALLVALSELVIAGLVALLAAAFGAPEAVMNLPALGRIEALTGLSLGSDPRILVLGILIALLVAVAGKNALALIQQWHVTSFSETVSNATRAHLLDFYLRAPFLWVTHTGTSSLLFGLSASTQLGPALTTALQIFSNSLILLTIFCGLLFSTFIPSLMFFGVLGLSALTLISLIRKRIDRRSQAVFAADRALHTLQLMTLNALKEMRLYGRESRLRAAYSERLNDLLRQKKRQQVLSKSPAAILELLGFSSLLVVFIFLLQVQEASLARIAGVMGFLAGAAWRCLPVANRLMDGISALRTTLPYLKSSAEQVRLEASFSDVLGLHPDAAGEPVSFKRELRLERVCFTYPDANTPALTDVSLTIRPGDMVGVVGLSGAGKSTLVNLLTGLITPDSGCIRIDGQRLERDNTRSWLARIGYVSQSPYLLDASLAENIALCRWGESLDRDRVRTCCDMAALDFVDQLPDGLNTILGERGLRLSGGQIQRVAIARALYGDPELIIFDEATSALDLKNEKAVLETILSLRSNVTMVIIAHRLSTVEGCDRIVWLERGEIVNQGHARDVLGKYTSSMT